MLIDDVRQAFRSFLRRPWLTFTVLLTLAIGIGATTAIFSIANGVLLRGLPYPNQDRLMVIYNSFGEVAPTDASYLDVLEWKRRNSVFDDMAMVVNWMEVTLTGGDRPERVSVNFVSSSFFELLGAKTVLGRTFLPEEDESPGGHPVTVLTYALWKNRYGSDAGIVGKKIRVNGLEYAVVGVLREDFYDVSDETQLFIPVSMLGTAVSPAYMENRGSRAFFGLGLLKKGVTREKAEEQMRSIAGELEKEFPDTNQGYNARVYRLIDNIYFHEHQIENLGRSMFLLVGGSIFLLLIACVNVANLLLVQATTRRGEIGVRVAMGASRWQIIRRLLTESVLLSLIGGALGLLVAHWGVRTLLTFSAVSLPAFVKVGIDGRALAVAMALAVVTGVAFGLIPALRVSKPNLRESLQGGSKQSSAGDAQLGRGALVVSEVALAVLLLIGAGLMIKSFQLLHKSSLGFETDRLLTFRVELPVPQYENRPKRLAFVQTLQEEVAAIPGVQRIGLWGPGLPGAGNFYVDITPQENPAQTPEGMVRSHPHHVGAGALEAIGIPILRGRDIAAEDTPEKPMVAVVSESIAESLWPGKDPLGKRFLAGGMEVTVIGVAANVLHRGRLLGAREDVPRDFYHAWPQFPVRSIALFLYSDADPANLAAPLREVVARLDPELPIYDIKTANERLYEEEAQMRLTAMLMGFFAAVALILASLGIYSVLAYVVSRRTGEIGIRMTLGATRTAIYRMVIGWSLVLVCVGLVLGLAGAFALTRVMRNLLFEVGTTDPAVFVLVPLVLALVAVMASWVPARRAMKVEPVSALRYE